MRILTPIVVLLLSSPATAEDEELAIYPGFSKAELPTSVRSVVEAATHCARVGKTAVQPKTRASVAPHLSAEIVDGKPVRLEERTINLSCGTRPVRACSYTYSWSEGTDQIGYASVQCQGSHEDAYTRYVVTASIDLRKADKPDVRGTRKDKAVVMSSLTFQTDAFPGSHVTAFAAHKRKDQSTVEAPRVIAFDDFAGKDDKVGGAVTTDELSTLAHEVLALSCVATRQCKAEDANGWVTAQR